MKLVCPRCGNGDNVCHDSDMDFEQMGMDAEGVATFCHCTECGCEMEFYFYDENPYSKE